MEKREESKMVVKEIMDFKVAICLYAMRNRLVGIKQNKEKKGRPVFIFKYTNKFEHDYEDIKQNKEFYFNKFDIEWDFY